MDFENLDEGIATVTTDIFGIPEKMKAIEDKAEFYRKALLKTGYGARLHEIFDDIQYGDIDTFTIVFGEEESIDCLQEVEDFLFEFFVSVMSMLGYADAEEHYYDDMDDRELLEEHIRTNITFGKN